jgi:hypothetical protein
VRLPLAFTEKLWTLTHLGTTVIIAGAHSVPWELSHPGMVLDAYAKEELDGAVVNYESKRHPRTGSRRRSILSQPSLPRRRKATQLGHRRRVP